MKFTEFLDMCGGIKYKLIKAKNKNQHDHRQYYIDGKIEVPDNHYLKVNSTSTVGTIGKLVEFEPYIWGDDEHISSFQGTFLLKVEGRSKLVRITSGKANYLPGYNGITKYVRNVKTHTKVEVKNPVNKFKQELNKEDWCVGVGKGGHQLKFGRITRWTNYNVWGVWGDDIKDKSKEFQFDSIQQTLLLPPDAHKQDLLVAMLKGYNGQ